MPTTGQTLLARGFAALTRVHPSVWALGVNSFTGTLGRKEEDQPEQLDAPVEMLVLTAQTSAVPAGAVRGQVIVNSDSGLGHRILRVRADARSGLTTLYLTESGVESGS